MKNIEFNNIRLDIEYDGTNFYGFQRQVNKRTVQGEIEKSILKLTKENINLVSSGRTDRGVHAINQVINFHYNGKVPVKNLMYSLNNILPEDIHIKKLTVESKDFNSRFSAKNRSYLYKMKLKKEYNVFEKNYYTYIDEKLDINKSNEILSLFKGKHDFENYRTTGCNAKNSIRTIEEIYLYENNSEMIIYIKANAFLKSMIRIIVANFMEVYTGKENREYIIDRLNYPGKYAFKLIAPPEGLYLYEVNY
ncbi:MAG: tRNA pseudouridine(38-40) synthase TruA [Fusobacteria bacterium]|nr:tRNA pseudouridine(38-40) synthase TruA [Fusobacteriota bacterium]